jgi:hypothetical protein
MIKKIYIYWSSCKELVNIFSISMRSEFCPEILEKQNIQIPNFMKIRQVGAELFYADRETDGET